VQAGLASTQQISPSVDRRFLLRIDFEKGDLLKGEEGDKTPRDAHCLVML
jgi:hypothetical protein